LCATAAAAVAKKPTDSPRSEAVTSTNIPVQHLRCKISENVYVMVVDTPGSKVRFWPFKIVSNKKGTHLFPLKFFAVCYSSVTL
jgi:hypothetical protein